MKPWLHAKSSAKKWGGKPEEYIAVHEFMDSTKSAHASIKHRAVLHNAFGIFLAELVFGRNLINSNGREVSVRDLAEQHVLEDLGTIPSLDDWLKHMTMEPWMGGPSRKTRTVSLEDDSYGHQRDDRAIEGGASAADRGGDDAGQVGAPELHGGAS